MEIETSAFRFHGEQNDQGSSRFAKPSVPGMACGSRPLLYSAGTGQRQVAGSTIASVRRAERDPFTLATRFRFHGEIGKWQAGSLQNCNRGFDSRSRLKTWPSVPATTLAR